MSPKRPPVLAAVFVLPLALALVAPAQEPKGEAVPPPPRPNGATVPKQALLKGMREPPLFIPARPATPPPPPAPPTAPTPVALDFPAQPVAQVIRTLSERTGGMVDTFNANDARWNDQRVTLEAPAPVPFWEAIDRLTAAAGIGRSVAPAGPFGLPPARVQFQAHFGPTHPASADEAGLVAYVGPFRVGPVVVHEHSNRVFLRPAGPAPGLAAAPPSAFYAEIALLAEPNLLAAQVGPLRGVEAVDDAGRSLADPKLGGEVPVAPSAGAAHGPPKSLAVPLIRGPKPSKALARLRAALPLEVARRPAAPTLVVPLEGGKTFRDGDVAITVREYKVDAQGQAVVRLTARIEGERGRGPAGPGSVAASRLWSIYHDQIELADAQGKPVRISGGNAGQGGPDSRELLMDYTFPPPTGSRPYPPTHLRIYRPEWVAWELPIEFRDVPLP